MSGPDPTAPPLPPGVIDRLVLDLGRRVPAHGMGGHLRRRLGQSLEFRDYQPYAAGQDIRRVDWRASLRTGRRDHWVARRYEAEARLRLMVVVDARPAMRLPVAAPKLLFALWVARLAAAVAGGGQDAVTLAGLFGPGPPVAAEGRRAAAVAASFARDLWAVPGDLASPPPPPDDRALIAAMEPASTVLLISDLLFEDSGGRVREIARAAQRAHRQLIVLELDSFAAEAAGLPGIRLFDPVEGRGFGPGARTVAVQDLAAARAAIDTHRAGLRADWGRGGLFWPPPVVWPEVPVLADLFARSVPHLPALRAATARGSR